MHYYLQVGSLLSFILISFVHKCFSFSTSGLTNYSILPRDFKYSQDDIGPVDILQHKLLSIIQLTHCHSLKSFKILPFCKQNSAKNEIRFCVYNSKIFAFTTTCQFPYYSRKQILELLRNKHVFLIGDSRFRYSFVTSIYWLSNGIWPPSDHNDTYKSVANEHNWQNKSQDYFYNWKMYYNDTRDAINRGEGRVTLDCNRSALIEDWRFEYAEYNIKLSFMIFSVSRMQLQPIYKGNRTSISFFRYLTDVVGSVDTQMPVTHAFISTGWVHKPWHKDSPSYMQAAGWQDALQFLLDRKIKVTYMTNYGSQGKHEDVLVKGVNVLDMYNFCTFFNNALIRNNNLHPMVLWDKLHYHAWAYYQMFQLIAQWF